LPAGGTIGCSINPNAVRNSWFVGMINAALHATGTLFGVWTSDPLSYFFGRRGAIFVCPAFVY
jgi:hypothetical protein